MLYLSIWMIACFSYRDPFHNFNASALMLPNEAYRAGGVNRVVDHLCRTVDPSVGMPAVDHAAHEDSVVRVKDLKDLVLPSPPENAGQARGFINQVLMAIGRL